MKKISVLLLALLVTISSFSSFASESQTREISIQNANGDYVVFEVKSKDYNSISNEFLLGIANKHLYADHFTIENIVLAPKTDSIPRVTPNSIGIIILPPLHYTKTFTEYRAVTSSKFLISVGKGASATISKAVNLSLAASVSGGIKSAEIGLTPSISYHCSTTRTFDGPPEGSAYNSRAWYVDQLADKGTYEGYRDFGGGTTAFASTSEVGIIRYSGTFVDPLEYAEYSVDRRY